MTPHDYLKQPLKWLLFIYLLLLPINESTYSFNVSCSSFNRLVLNPDQKRQKKNRKGCQTIAAMRCKFLYDRYLTFFLGHGNTAGERKMIFKIPYCLKNISYRSRGISSYIPLKFRFYMTDLHIIFENQ